MCCSPKCKWWFAIIFFSFIALLQGASSALNFISGAWEAGIGFAAAAFMSLLVVVVVSRLGYKTFPMLVQEELENQRLIGNTDNFATANSVNGGGNVQRKKGSRNSSNVSLQQQNGGPSDKVDYSANNRQQADGLAIFQSRLAEAEYRALEEGTVFRRSGGPFIFFAVVVMLAALGASGWFLYKAIESHDKFNPFEQGNAWVPFIAYLVVAPPCSDVMKHILAAKRGVRNYFLNGGGSMV